jgi:hypothetical protein
MHHVRFVQGDKGLSDYAKAVGCLVASMFDVVEDLAAAEGQRLVRIMKLDPNRRRHETVNPKTDPRPIGAADDEPSQHFTSQTDAASRSGSEIVRSFQNSCPPLED